MEPVWCWCGPIVLGYRVPGVDSENLLIACVYRDAWVDRLTLCAIDFSAVIEKI